MIRVNSLQNEFYLETKNTSYIMKVLDTKHLVNLYYGRKIRYKDDFSSLYHTHGAGLGNLTDYSEKYPNLSLETMNLEFSTSGKGDYREPSIELTFSDNSNICDFLYHSYSIDNNKKEVENLPHTFGEDISNLEIKFYDEVMNVYLILSYSVFYDCDAIVRSLKIYNASEESVIIERAMSLNLDFNYGKFDAISLEGKYIKERYINRRELNKGVYYIDSKKGVSGSYNNPFLALVSNDAREERGECYGFGLVYSGNHRGLVEVSPHNITRVQMGINPFDFSWTLSPEEFFQTPEVILTYSTNGLNGMSSNFHNMINNHLIKPQWRNVERPVVINNWEATYFNFNEKKLLKLAKAAKDIGVEMFVLDDGWFGKRDNDKSSLGDWKDNIDKLPGGLEGLSTKINELGLKFGIWVEPEMISPESELYRQHPEWAIKHSNRQPSLGRNQLILDLSNPEVVDYLYEIFKDVFDRSKTSFVKWDMNRNFSDMYSNYLPKENQRELSHRYMLGLYKLMDKLTKEFPDILFEACSAGGNRFDLGMLYYMPQIWASDNTDGIERLNIQYGTSLLYPLNVISAHVSCSPNHQTLRTTPIETRFNTAAFGVLGYELDITRLSNFDKKAIANQIEFYKAHRSLLQFGNFCRITSPFDTNKCIWMVVSKDKKEALLGYYQKLQETSPDLETIKLQGLNEELLYDVEARLQYVNVRNFGELVNEHLPINIKDGGIVQSLIAGNYMYECERQHTVAYGDELMYCGFKPYSQFSGIDINDKISHIGDFGSRIYYIKACEEK